MNKHFSGEQLAMATQLHAPTARYNWTPGRAVTPAVIDGAVSQEGAVTGRTTALPTSFGVLYPRGYVTAVIDDTPAAEAAVAALCRDGTACADIVLFSGPQLLEHTVACRARVGLVRRLFQQVFMDEMDYWRDYQDEADQGHIFLAVRASDIERARCVHALLASFQAHAVRYYGLWTITDLL